MLRFQKAALGSLSGSGLPPIEEFEEFIALDILKPPELIKGMLHQGSKMLISGGSKAHKTWALIDMAVSVHTGTPLWGLQTTQANVLYVNLELDRYFAQYRCKEIRRAKNIPNAKGLGIWNLRGYSCDISELRKRLMPEILKGDYGLIIFDPIYKTYGGRDEILDAVGCMLRTRGAQGATATEIADDLSSETFQPYLYAPDIPEPDLIVRTSGEMRLSGFMLWQSVYSELYFSDVPWPAFRKIDFLRAIRSFQVRRRRYGK